MHINLSAKSSAITPPMKDYALQKVEKLEKYVDRIQKIEIILDAEKERKIAEIIAFTPGHKMVATGVEEDIHAAIDFAVGKLESQLIRVKSKLRDHHRRSKEEPLGVPSEKDDDDKEETYQEIIDKTNFGEKPSEE